MKLLILTQVLDSDSSTLGFFHRWIEECAKHWEHIHVVCLYEGIHHLPSNVTVHSLGKNEGKGRLTYLIRFFTLITKLRKEYGSVFVHMNAEYVVLGGMLWRLWNKKIGLWYNHTVGSVWLQLGAPFAHHIFHTSPYAYTARYLSSQKMPAGIDMEVFFPRPEVKKIPKSIYFQGRISPAKKIHILMESFVDLYTQGSAERLTLVGPEIESYTAPLKDRYKDLIEKEAIVFLGEKRNEETPLLYAEHEVSVNLTADGNYDKTVLESLACGTAVVVASRAFKDLHGVTTLETCTSTALSTALTYILSRKEEGVFDVSHHSLSSLGLKIKDFLA